MVVVEDTHLDETWYFLYDRWELDRIQWLLPKVASPLVLKESPFGVISAEACVARG